MIVARPAPLALVALLAASCGANDKKNATPATATETTTTSTTATTSTVSTGPSGTTPIPAKPSSKGLNLKGKNAPKLEVGRQADFIGHLVLAQANDAGQTGVRGKSGQAMLQNQGVYVLVSVGDLKLH
jgi:hypothetical protein